MNTSDKRHFIIAFFDEWEKKVELLPGMRSASYADEAFTLCIVYIDRLASGYYETGRSWEKFCRALKQLSGNPLFGMLHPGELLRQARQLEQTQQRFIGTEGVLSSMVGTRPHTLLDDADAIVAIQSSALQAREKNELIAKLWKASIASICYVSIRGPEIHGPGSGGLDFDETIYRGKAGLRIDFDLVYRALLRILAHVRNASVQSGHWFGNPNYLAPRSSPLRKEQGVWVFRGGKKLSAAATDKVLRDMRETRDRNNFGPGA
jgi:hypothetical protein